MQRILGVCATIAFVVAGLVFLPSSVGAAQSCATNDDRACAMDLGTSSHLITVSNSNVGATGELGEPNICGSTGDQTSVWFKWVNGNGFVHSMLVDTVGSDFDTQIAVYRGPALKVEGCNDDALPLMARTESMFSFRAGPGTTYWIQVQGATAADQGTITLNLRRPAYCEGWNVNLALSLFNFAPGTTIETGPGDNIVNGSVGPDIIDLGAGDDVACGGDGDDVIMGGDGTDIIYGGDGDDEIHGGSGRDFIQGDDGADELYGGPWADFIRGDAAYSFAGEADYIEGGAGNDTILGGGGNDEIRGGYGEDELWGGHDDDLIYGDNQNDVIYGNHGNDTMFGGRHDDAVYGQGGDDIIWGQSGDDARLSGSKGRDKIYGGGGNDYVDGGDDRDKVYGQGGDDTVLAGRGDDWRTDGGPGTDTCDVGSGNDMPAINCEN